MNSLTRLAPGLAPTARVERRSHPFLHLLLAAFCLSMAILLLTGDSPVAALPCFLASAYLAALAVRDGFRDERLRPRRPWRRSTMQPSRPAAAGQAHRSPGRVS